MNPTTSYMILFIFVYLLEKYGQSMLGQYYTFSNRSSIIGRRKYFLYMYLIKMHSDASFFDWFLRIFKNIYLI